MKLHTLQIRTHLSEAGLDPASNSDTSACIAQAKKDMESEKNKAKGAKTDKSGTLAITFLESLMETLSLVYGMVEQGPDAHNGSDYRLVVTSWKEQPIRSARCTFRTLLACVVFYFILMFYMAWCLLQ